MNITSYRYLLLLSLMIHTAVIISLKRPQQAPPVSVPFVPSSITIVPVEKSLPAILLNPETPLDSNSQQPTIEESKPVQGIANSNVETKTYNTLVPAPGSLPISSDSGVTSSEIPTFLRRNHHQIKGIATDIDFSFNFPFKLAEEIDQGKATASIVQEDGQIILRSLSGLPYLRAIIYEGINKPEFELKFKELFKLFKSSSFSITVKMTKEFGREIALQKSTKILPRKIMIKLTKQIPASDRFSNDPGGSGGITLPDKHAERAEARNKLHFESLRKSPAYRRVIRNRLLFYLR